MFCLVNNKPVGQNNENGFCNNFFQPLIWKTGLFIGCRKLTKIGVILMEPSTYFCKIKLIIIII